MPIKHAAIKHLRQTIKRTAHNKSVKNTVKKLVKSTRQAIVAKDKTKASDLFKKTVVALDKAAQKKILAKNTAARLKSRLARQVNKI